MPVNTLKPTPELRVVSSQYHRDDGTQKTIAEILGKPEDDRSEITDFSELVQSRVVQTKDTITLKIAEWVERILSRWKRVQEFTSQSGSPLLKKDIITFIKEAFGKNDTSEWNDNFFMIGGEKDPIGREVVKFFHSIVWLQPGKHYWLADRGLALYIDTSIPEMLYIVKLDKDSWAYNL
jgi:hypothetical protein